MHVLVPICCFCEKVQDDDETESGQGRWVYLNTYQATHHFLPKDVWLSPTCCPDCTCRKWNVRALGLRRKPWKLR